MLGIYTFFYAHVRIHVRTFRRGYAGRLHLYIDVLGTEIWRDPLDSTRLAIIQFIGLSKAPVHAVFPDRSLSLSLFFCLSTVPFRFFPSRFLSYLPTLLPSFSAFREAEYIYRPSVPFLPFSSRYNCLLSLVLSNRLSSPIFRLRSTRCYPSFAAALRAAPAPFGGEGGWRTIRSNTLR